MLTFTCMSMGSILDNLQMFWLFSQQTTALFVLIQAWLYILPFSQKMAVISTHWAGNCGANAPWRWKAICRRRKFLHEVKKKKVWLTWTAKLEYPQFSYYSSSVASDAVCWSFQNNQSLLEFSKDPLMIAKTTAVICLFPLTLRHFWLQGADDLHLVDSLLQCRKFKPAQLLSSSLTHSG